MLKLIFLFALLLCACSAEPRTARCATDANVKVPLSGLVAPSMSEWAPQLSGWTIRVPWSAVEAQQGQYIFTAIDEELNYADASDGFNLQGVNIEILTGDNVPGWLLESTPEGLVSPFWKASYQQAYRDLMSHVASRYDGHKLVRGVVLSACTPSSAPSAAAYGAGYTDLQGEQCYYSAMFSHVAYWVNTPTILALPFKIDATWETIIDSFRSYLGPRLGVLSVTQDIANAFNKANFALLKRETGANSVLLTGTLPKDSSIEHIFSLLALARITTVTLPSGWSTVNVNFIPQAQLDELRTSLAQMPLDCNFAPGRALLSASQSTSPSASWEMFAVLSPDGHVSRDKIFNAVVAVTGLPSSRFMLGQGRQLVKSLVVRGYVYDQPFTVPASSVAQFLGSLSADQWRAVGLEARSTGYDPNLANSSNSGDDSMDGLYIFLIVLASVIYVCVFAIFCYLMVFIVRYCARDGNGNATMAKISSAGNRIRGWVRFHDADSAGSDAGFPSTTTTTTPAAGATEGV